MRVKGLFFYNFELVFGVLKEFEWVCKLPLRNLSIHILSPPPSTPSIGSPLQLLPSHHHHLLRAIIILRLVSVKALMNVPQRLRLLAMTLGPSRPTVGPELLHADYVLLEAGARF